MGQLSVWGNIVKGTLLLLGVLFFSFNVNAKSLEETIYDNCRVDLGDKNCQKILKHSKRIGTNILDYLTTTVRPKAMQAYKKYDEAYNKTLTPLYLKYFPKLKNKYKASKKLLFETNPEFFEGLKKSSTPAKRMYEEFLHLVWAAMYLATDFPNKEATDISNISHAGIDIFKTRTGILRAPRNVQKRLDALLNDLRPYALNSSMSSCFKVSAIPVSHEAVLVTGCNIYVFEGVYSYYDDNQIRAIIAHEMYHAISGDYIIRIAEIIKNAVAHLVKYDIEALIWLFTDEELEYLKEHSDKSLTESILQKIHKDMHEDELNADKYSVIILNAAGFSGMDAISALHKGYGIKNGESPEEVENNYTEGHPSAYERERIIRQTMKF